jgi:hypothetical protein
MIVSTERLFYEINQDFNCRSGFGRHSGDRAHPRRIRSRWMPAMASYLTKQRTLHRTIRTEVITDTETLIGMTIHIYDYDDGDYSDAQASPSEAAPAEQTIIASHGRSKRNRALQQGWPLRRPAAAMYSPIVKSQIIGEYGCSRKLSANGSALFANGESRSLMICGWGTLSMQ